jgi:hypothetical protein
MSFFDLHYLITAVAYPLVNCAVLTIYLYGSFHSRWQRGFALLSAAIVLLLIRQFSELFLMIQKHFGVPLISQSTAKFLWPIGAVTEYFSLILYVCGAVTVVHVALKHSRTNVA